MPPLNKPVTAVLISLLLVGGIAALFYVLRPLLLQGSKVRVVAAYQGQANYVTALRENPEADKDAAYQKYVNDRYQEDCGIGGGVIRGLTDPASPSIARHPTGSLDLLEVEVMLLNGSDVARWAKTAMQRAAEALPPSQAITACIYALDPIQRGSDITASIHGILGQTWSPTSFLIEIYPQDDLQVWLPYAVVREYYHTVAYLDTDQPPATPASLLERVVAEGRADAFAHLLYPGLEASWTVALTTEQEAAQWQVMQPYLTSTAAADINRFMVGDSQTPLWTGYTIGYHIVQSYLQSHPEASVADWSKLDAQKLLHESGYTGRP